MADGVFFLIAVLAKAAISHIKQRIISKSVISGQRIPDHALAGSLRGQFRPIRENTTDRANIAAGPFFCRNTGQLPQKLLVVAVIPFAAVSGGIDARRAAQRIHAKAGIIRNRRQAGQAASFFCFDTGVLGKGGACLLHIQRQAHFF